jgi:hypothetical protein
MKKRFVSGRCRLILPKLPLAGFLMLACLFPGFQSAAAEPIVLGFENREQWENWQEITFPGRANTRYEFDPDGLMACAEAVASASALFHEFPWELADYPILSWEWRIEHVLDKGDARARKGDDYAGRVYVNFEREERLGWWERARARMFELIYGQELPGQALNFIWANLLEIGEIVTSPYTEHARLVALQSGNQRAGEWVREEVNIPEQYRKAFAGVPPRVHSLAIMTDSDDTGETARACYRNITIKKSAGSAGGRLEGR